MKKIFVAKGITLIALIITVIVLLILAGVGISMITGDNGILNKAKLAKENSRISQDNENNILGELDSRLDNALGTTSREVMPTYCNTQANSLTTSTASLSNPCVVVESYRSGTEWCRVSSDGWIEQGGYKASAGTITFIKPFSDTNYTITGGLLSGTESSTYEHLNFSTFKTTSVYFSTYDGYKLKWYACGY